MSRIWAIARNLIREVLRMRVLMGLVILVTVLVTFVFSWWLHGNEGMVDEKVQTFLSYSLRFTTGFLALITVFVSILTVSRDLKRKEIFMISTKPIHRGEYLAGKFLGMAVLNFVFLLAIGAIIYVLAITFSWFEQPSDYEQVRLRDLVYVARRSVRPQWVDVSAEAKEQAEEIVKEQIRKEPERYQNRPELIQKMRQDLRAIKTKELRLKQTAVSPGGHTVFRFENLKPRDRENGTIYIRYKQDVSVNPMDEHVFNIWAYNSRDPLLHGANFMPYSRDRIRTVHEFSIPADSVSQEGDLYVYYQNPTINRSVTTVFPMDTGIEALYVAGGFTGNYVRCLGLLYLRLLFLSLFGVAMGACLSFPVAVLLVLVVYVMGLSSGYLTEAVQWETPDAIETMTRVLLDIFPKFSSYDPLGQIEKGRMVEANLLGQCLLFMLLIKGSIVGGIGYVVFRFRELARVNV